MSLPPGRALPLIDPLLAVVFPSYCAACRAPLDRPLGGPLCPACLAALPRHTERACRCGLPLAGAATLCSRCRRGLTPFAAGASVGPYEGGLRTLIHEFKYAKRRRVAGLLAEALLREPAARRLLTGDAVLVPVPLHPRRRRQRGFNQAELLARELARRTGLPLAGSALARARETPPQTGLSAAKRRRNVAGAFVVREAGEVAGRVVVLVDDVMTTGATAGACSRALARAGARELRVLTAARVRV